MVGDIFELRTQNQNKVYKKRLKYYALRFTKSVFKMASEDPQNTLLKSTKNMKLSGFFSEFWGPNYSSYQRFEATFQWSVFPKL